MKAFLFILAIITNEGTLEMKAVPMDACPEKEPFIQAMEKLKKEGQFIGWNAICHEQTKGVSL